MHCKVIVYTHIVGVHNRLQNLRGNVFCCRSYRVVDRRAAAVGFQMQLKFGGGRADLVADIACCLPGPACGIIRCCWWGRRDGANWGSAFHRWTRGRLDLQVLGFIWRAGVHVMGPIIVYIPLHLLPHEGLLLAQSHDWGHHGDGRGQTHCTRGTYVAICEAGGSLDNGDFIHFRRTSQAIHVSRGKVWEVQFWSCVMGIILLSMGWQWWRLKFQRHSSSSSRVTVALGHVSIHVYFEVALGCKCSSTHDAFKGFLARMSTVVNLQSTGTRKRFLTYMAEMFWEAGRSFWWSWRRVFW